MLSSNSLQLQVLDAKTLKQALSDRSVVLVDVREADEYAAEHLPGAELQPLSKFDPSQVRPSDGKKLVLYCRSGNRSTKAASQLLSQGVEVSHLDGGIMAWKQAGYPTQKTANAPISLFRQVQIVAGSLVLLGTILGATVSPAFLLLSGFVGAGLMFSGITDTCAMGMLLAKLPYNQRAK